MHKPILVLDYSTDGNSGAMISRWLPAPVTVVKVEADEPFPPLLPQDYRAAVHSGSALSIVDNPPFMAGAVAFINSACTEGVPQMGICYGHQLLAKATAGPDAVAKSASVELGWLPVDFLDSWPVPGLSGSKVVWHSHYDCVKKLPAGSVITATNSHTAIQAFFNRSLKLFGTQFHPEFDKPSGDECYIREEELFAKHGISLQDTLKKEPGFNTGKVVFGDFLKAFESDPHGL